MVKQGFEGVKMEKEFDWKCKTCKRDIPKGEGHVDENCLICAEDIMDAKEKSSLEDLIPDEDLEHAENEIKAKSKKIEASDVETG